MLKSSFLHVMRTPVKTTLFASLLAAVTVFICFGSYMWLSVNYSLDAANQAYTTIGVVEYRSPQDPNIDRTLYYDYLPLTESGFVEFLDHRALVAGFSERLNSIPVGKHRWSNYISVVEFTPAGNFKEDNIIKAKIVKVHYSTDLSIKERAVISLAASPEIKSVEAGKKYLTCIRRLDIDTYSSYRDWDLQRIAELLGIEESGDIILEIPDADYLESSSGMAWSHLIRKYINTTHTASVYATNDLNSMLIFHQGKAMVTKGRSFSQEDYQVGNRVCLISETMAKVNGLEPGDFIPLSFSEGQINITNSILYIDSFNHLDILEEGDYEIIGIYQLVGRMDGAYGFYEDTIFIPQKSISLQPYMTRDNFVSFRLANGKVEAFLEEMEQYDLSGLNFTFYDQGYSKVSGALAGLRENALLLTGVCAAGGLGIVLLFSLLYVGRQQRTIAIMYSLGTSRGKALAFLLITVLMVAGLSVVLGGLAGYALSDRVMENVYARSAQEVSLSATYSEVYGEDNEVEFQAIAPDKPIAPLIAAGTVLAVTLVLSGIFAAKVLRAEPMQVLTEKEK
jgi:hypothetical protein